MSVQHRIWVPCCPGRFSFVLPSIPAHLWPVVRGPGVLLGRCGSAVRLVVRLWCEAGGMVSGPVSIRLGEGPGLSPAGPGRVGGPPWETILAVWLAAYVADASGGGGRMVGMASPSPSPSIPFLYPRLHPSALTHSGRYPPYWLALPVRGTLPRRWPVPTKKPRG